MQVKLHEAARDLLSARERLGPAVVERHDLWNVLALLAEDATSSPDAAGSGGEAREAGEVETIADDEAIEAISDCFNGNDLYGLTEAWAEGKTLSVLFKETGQIAKLRFVKLVDKPSNADLRGEPA